MWSPALPGYWTATSSFHPTARRRQEDEIVDFARARVAATSSMGGTNTIRTFLPSLSSSKLADSSTDCLSSKDIDLSHPSYQRLITAGSQVASLGTD